MRGVVFLCALVGLSLLETVASVPTVTPTPHHMPIVPPNHPAPDCANLPDGNYNIVGNPCPRGFYQCAHGVAFYTPCGGVLRFDAHVQGCAFKHQMAGCAGVTD